MRRTLFDHFLFSIFFKRVEKKHNSGQIWAACDNFQFEEGKEDQDTYWPVHTQKESDKTVSNSGCELHLDSFHIWEELSRCRLGKLGKRLEAGVPPPRQGWLRREGPSDKISGNFWLIMVPGWDWGEHFVDIIREGFRKKNVKKYGLLPNPLRTPPPPTRFGHFSHEKNWPPFFFRNKTLIGWNKFYTWSHLKIYSFLLLKWLL